MLYLNPSLLMARVNKSQYAILGCLSLRPMTAYDIKKFMDRTTGYFWTEREGQLYPTLKELEQKKLVTSKEKEALKIGFKKIYSITQRGREHLKIWLAKPVETQVYRNELLLKLFFGNNQEIENNLRLLKGSLIELEQSIGMIKVINTAQVGSQRKIYPDIVIDYGLMLLEAEIAWCKKSIHLLERQL
jgi:PadR family transcriptional regulator AphA